MKNLYLAMLIFCFVSSSYSQSKIELDKQSLLYKTNKVKIQTIDYGSGRKNVTKYNQNGKPTESHDYYNNIEANITTYKYDKKGRMTEESYYGYESGDGNLSKYYYDENENVAKIVSSGSDESEVEYSYDIHGNIIETEYHDIALEPGPPLFQHYLHTYEADKLTFTDEECTLRREEIFQTKYTYEESNVIMIEVFYKKCSTGEIILNSKQTFEYFENGLIKESIVEGIYNEAPQKNIYSYEFY